MTAKLKEWLIVGGLVALVAAFFIFRQSERHKGAVAVLTHQNDSTIKVQVGIVQQTARKASLDSLHQVAALSAARQQIVKQKADSARQDSLVRVSANERARAEAVLRDSLATVQALRHELSGMVASSRADSATYAELHRQDQASIRSLLTVVAADSVASSAKDRQVASLQALNKSLKAEVDLVKQAQPSFIGRHASLTIGAGCAEQSGNVACGPAIVAGWKVLP